MSMQHWRLSLKANGKDLGEVNVKRGIFQGDTLSLLFLALTIAFDSSDDKCMLYMGKEGM